MYACTGKHTHTHARAHTHTPAPSDDVFYARYRQVTLLHWLAHATINSDPYGEREAETDTTDTVRVRE